MTVHWLSTIHFRTKHIKYKTPCILISSEIKNAEKKELLDIYLYKRLWHLNVFHTIPLVGVITQEHDVLNVVMS